MNRENQINVKQNEESSIRFLAAQREIYEEVKRYEKVVVFFNVLLPIICSILNIFSHGNLTLETATYLVAIVSMFIGLFFRRSINKEKSIAANIQLQFDMHVYQLPWDKDLFGKKMDLYDVIAEKSNKHLINEENQTKLFNWYRPEVSKYDYLNSIAFCQKENLAWDGRLRRRYRRYSIISILFTTSLILGSCIIAQDSFSGLLLKLIFITPLLYWLFDTIKKLDADIDRLKELKNRLDEPLKIKRLQIIQKDITEHRKHCMSIPKWFYNRFREKDEMIQKTVDSINQ